MNASHPQPSFARRAFGLAMALCLLLALVPAPEAKAAPFYQDAVDNLLDWGVMSGYPDGSLKPENNITRAEFVAMVNRAYGYRENGPTPFTDVPVSAWYSDDIGIAYNAGYFNGTGPNTASPNAPLTREQAMVLLAKNMRLDEVPGEVTAFSDSRDFATWSRGYVRAAAAKGLITGYSDGSFAPKNNITRGEMAVLLNRALGNLVHSSGTHSLGSVYGNVTVNAPGTVLRDTTVAGDLYVTGGLGLGGVTLENVRVLGEIVVAGSGESESGDSVLLRNTQSDSLKIDAITGQYVSLRADGDTVVDSASVRTPAFIIDRTSSGQGLRGITLEGGPGASFTLAGNIESVSNKSPSSSLTVSTGTVQSLTMEEESEGSSLFIDSNATVRSLDLDTGVNVTGGGDIDALGVNTAGSTVAMLPDRIDIRPGVTAKVAGETMDTRLGQEASADPRILAGYPKTINVAATSGTAVFSTNKAGTVYWAVSALSDGSVEEDDLMSPAYSAIAISSGNIKAAASNTEYTGNMTKMTSGGSYYLSAMLVDARGDHSPVKVFSFTTPDNTIPAFASGYPYMSRITNTSAQVAVMTTKSCDLYYALLAKGSSAPTAAELRSAAVTGAYGYGVVPVQRNEPELFYVNNLRDLTELASYDLYLWLNDADNARSSSVRKLSFTTVDRTPPVFLTRPTVTSFTGNNIRLSCVVNEAGTVYWACVTSDTDYPKLNNNNVLTEEWARIQVENGSNVGTSGKSGKVTVRANTDATINITGLKPETEYKIYYIAKDTAGNYSAVTIETRADGDRTVYEMKEYVTQGTLDTVPPTATQEFTRYSGTDSSRPYADTDVRIIFRENVLWRNAPSGDEYEGGRLLNLYRNARDAGQGSDAMNRFTNALRSTIKLYDATGSNAANPPQVVERVSDSQAGSWVIDYRNARVEYTGGELIVVFPTVSGDNGDKTVESALNLNSGSSYFFQIEDIADTSSARNPMGITKLPTFTTISAQVALEDLNLTSLNSGGSAVDVDIAFTLTPVSTETVDRGIDWDMLLWADASIEYQLYRRKAEAKGVENTNEWTLLPGTGRVSFTSDAEGMLGQSLNQHFATATTSQNHPLYQLTDVWEYAVHITKMDESTERGAWSKAVTFQINIVSGGFRALQTLATNITEDTYAAAIAGTTPWSDASKADDITTPERFRLVAPFTDTTPPSFADAYPQFTAGDSAVNMTLMLDRPGTIYYVIAPYTVGALTAPGAATYTVNTSINTRDRSNTALVARVQGDGYSAFSNDGTDREVPTTGIDNSNIPAGGTRTPQFELSQPTPSAVYNPRYSNASIKTGSISVGDGAVPVTVSDLDPETDYFAYFVMKGNGQVYSEYTQLYQFHTTEVDRPVIELSISNPSVNVSSKDKNGNDAAAAINYQLVTYNVSRMSSVLTGKFTDSCDSSRMTELKRALYNAGLIASATADIPESFTCLEAMATDYRVGNYSQGSIFDEFAGEGAKNAMREYIRNSTPTAGAIVKTGALNLPTVSGRTTSYSTVVNCANEMSANMWYVFLAVGRNPNGSGDAFRAVYPVQKIDEEAPKITVAALSGNFDPTDGTFKGTPTLTIQFDEPLYYKQQTSSPVSQTIIPVVATESTLGGSSNVISVNLVSTKPELFELVPSTSANADTEPCQTLVYKLNGVYNGDTITFYSQLCDEGGQTRSPSLSIQIRITSAIVSGSRVYSYDVVIPSAWDARVG